LYENPIVLHFCEASFLEIFVENKFYVYKIRHVYWQQSNSRLLRHWRFS